MVARPTWSTAPPCTKTDNHGRGTADTPDRVKVFLPAGFGELCATCGVSSLQKRSICNPLWPPPRGGLRVTLRATQSNRKFHFLFIIGSHNISIIVICIDKYNIVLRKFPFQSNRTPGYLIHIALLRYGCCQSTVGIINRYTSIFSKYCSA